MKRRHSIKFKITILLVSIITGIVILILFLNSTFCESYYQKTKEDTMLEAYKNVDAIVAQYEKDNPDFIFIDSVEMQKSTIGMSVLIVNSGLVPIYASDKIDGALLYRLEINLFGIADYTGQKDSDKSDSGKSENKSENKPENAPKLDENNSTIIEQSDSYTIQKVFDSRLNDYYLEIWGTLSTGDFILIRLPMQSIKDSVSIANTFIQYVGVGVILLGVIIAYFFSRYITKPIKELSTIAERMAELDFDAKYKGKDKGELGLLGNSMNYMSGKLQDNISHLKAANIELKKDIENKIQIEEMRNDFLSNVSHELKTPIALIQGYSEGLKEGISDDPESMDFYCDVIMDEANKMNNMVKKLLTLNQIEFGNEELIMDRFDVTELIRSIVNANEIRANQNNIEMLFEQTEPVYVWSDEYKIEEVITNYISNAINHCDFDKHIIIKTMNKENCVRVSVFNTGKIIPEEDINNIWIKFYKVDKARTREYGGNGIGLSIVKAILDSYDKECGVINHENGVEFWFELDNKKE